MRAPLTGSSVPELPDFNAQLAELPGAQETNAALQRWWDLVRQRIEFNSGDINKRLFTLKASFTDSDTSLSAEIEGERVVRANADSALAFDILTVSATVDGLSATVTTLSSALATAEGYLESRWTVNVSAGPIVTGMTLFSASGPDTNVSYIAFQADRFQMNTAAGNKVLFSATASAILLGNVLTVDLANTKLFVGTGTYANANTYFYVDTVSGGRFSLGSKFVWDGANLVVDGSGTFTGSITATSGAIGGWAIGATTLTGGNATLNSAGILILGTSNDVVYISAADATYRIWIGNATAASAAFRVTKAGVMTATNGVFSGSITSTSGTIGGFTIANEGFSAGSGTSLVSLFSGGGFSTPGLTLGNETAGHALFLTRSLFDMYGFAGGTADTVVAIYPNGRSGVIDLRTFGALTIQLRADTGDISATTFTGSGASLTSLNASNLASGTVPTARLGSGTANSSSFLRGDQTWAGITSGNVSGLAASATTDTTNASNISSGTLANARLPTAIDISTLDLSGNGILYDGVGGANRIAFLWDGSNVRVYVDNTLQGTIPNP